jgi:hypothetical protein
VAHFERRSSCRTTRRPVTPYPQGWAGSRRPGPVRGR